MATDAQTLLDAAKCYECYGSNQFQLELMKLALLRQQLIALSPMADTSPATLLAQANCYACFGSNGYQLKLMELALLAQISSALGTSVDVNQVVPYTGTDPNSDGVKPGNLNDGAIAYKKDGTGPTYGWNTTLQTWN